MPSMFARRLAYFLGALGYTTPFFLIALYWINFYNPPVHENLPALLPRGPLFLGISALSVIIVAVRLLDVIIDPWIARTSDASRNPRGRRLPMMEKSFLPAAACMLLVFLPPAEAPGLLNALWVTGFLILGVAFFSAYVTPFLAQMDALCANEEERLGLSLFQGLGESGGVVLAGQAPLLWGLLEAWSAEIAPAGSVIDGLAARQLSFAILCGLAALCMLAPALLLRGSDRPLMETEAGLADAHDSATSFRSGVGRALAQRGFVAFLLAYAVFIACVEMIQAGGYYYVTVLLMLDESWLSLLIALMVPASIASAPAATGLARRYGKKPVILGVFAVLVGILGLIFFLGRLPFAPELQAVLVFMLGGVPLGGMTALVMAVVTEQTQLCRARYGQAPQAVFVAGKNLAYKLGIAVGAGLFASLALLGKDRGADDGIRISALAALGLCLIAGALFAALYREGSSHKKSDAL